MTVPYTFGTATTSIPLSNLDANFNTPITLGNTSIYLGNTTTTIGNLTLTNATISSGTVNITNVTVTTANVTNITITGTANIATGNITTLTSTSITDSGLTSGRVTFAGANGLLTDSSNLTWNGSTFSVTGQATIGNRLTLNGVGTSELYSTDASGMYLTAATSGGMYIASNGPFYFRKATAPFTEYIQITSAGNVGIGTSSPTGRLDVVYDSALVGRFYSSAGRGLVRVDGLTDSSFQAYKNGSLVGFFQTDSGGTEIVTGTSGAFPYSIYTNNTERMRITSAGLVSITGAGTEVLALNKLGGSSAYLQPVSNTDSGLQVKDSGGTVTLTVGTSTKSVALQGGTVSSGTGITFPSSQNASSDANTLDDYEEGTFTVGLTAGTSGTITTNTQSGSYVRIGRQVTINAYITVSSVSAPVGVLRMTGLPFPNGGTRCAVSIWPNSLTASAITGVVGFVQTSESTVVLYVYTAGNGAVDMASYVQAGTSVAVALTYFV
jgi:hypothetical protein